MLISKNKIFLFSYLSGIASTLIFSAAWQYNALYPEIGIFQYLGWKANDLILNYFFISIGVVVGAYCCLRFLHHSINQLVSKSEIALAKIQISKDQKIIELQKTKLSQYEKKLLSEFEVAKYLAISRAQELEVIVRNLSKNIDDLKFMLTAKKSAHIGRVLNDENLGYAKREIKKLVDSILQILAFQKTAEDSARMIIQEIESQSMRLPRNL